MLSPFIFQFLALLIFVQSIMAFVARPAHSALFAPISREAVLRSRRFDVPPPLSMPKGCQAASSPSTEGTDGVDRKKPQQKKTGARNEPSIYAEMQNAWAEYVQSNEVQQVRQQLIRKYVQVGRSVDEAEVEVDEFLSDRARSEEFLEMRRYAHSQNTGDDFLPLCVAFAILAGVKYLMDYKVGVHDSDGLFSWIQ